MTTFWIIVAVVALLPTVVFGWAALLAFLPDMFRAGRDGERRQP